MTNGTVKVTDLLLTLTSLQHLIFCVLFNKTKERAKREQRPGAGRPVQAHHHGLFNVAPLLSDFFYLFLYIIIIILTVSV